MDKDSKLLFEAYGKVMPKSHVNYIEMQHIKKWLIDSLGGEFDQSVIDRLHGADSPGQLFDIAAMATGLDGDHLAQDWLNHKTKNGGERSPHEFGNRHLSYE